MKRTKIMFAAPVVVLAAFGVAAGSASATKLQLEAGGVTLPAGAPLTATSTNFVIADSTHGTIVCGESSMGGTLQASSGAHDLAAVESMSTVGSPSEPDCSTEYAKGPGTLTESDLP